MKDKIIFVTLAILIAMIIFQFIQVAYANVNIEKFNDLRRELSALERDTIQLHGSGEISQKEFAAYRVRITVAYAQLSDKIVAEGL